MIFWGKENANLLMFLMRWQIYTIMCERRVTPNATPKNSKLGMPILLDQKFRHSLVHKSYVFLNRLEIGKVSNRLRMC